MRRIGGAPAPQMQNQGGFNQPYNDPNGVAGWGTPPESPKKRRVWLWIIVGLLIACVVCCIIPTIYFSTIGEDQFNDFATRISDFATETVQTPTSR